MRHSPKPGGLRPASVALAASAVLVIGLGRPQAFAQQLFQPGQSYGNVAAAGIEIARVPTNASPTLEAVVSFSRADAITQNMRLLARSRTVARTTATARGALVVDFCVPRVGASGCDTVSEPGAPDIDLTLTFRYGLVGDMRTSVGTSASMALSASLIDLERNLAVLQRTLESLQSSGANWTTIAGVPSPVANWEEAQVNEAVTFQTSVRRGKRYRFQLAGSAHATGIGGVEAFSNMARPLDWAPLGQSGRVQLQNLTVVVGQEAPDLEAQVQSLRASLLALGEGVSALGSQVDGLQEGLQGGIDELSERQFTLVQRTTAAGALLMRLPGASSPAGGVYLGTYLLDPGPQSRFAPLPVRVYRMPQQDVPTTEPAATAR